VSPSASGDAAAVLPDIALQRFQEQQLRLAPEGLLVGAGVDRAVCRDKRVVRGVQRGSRHGGVQTTLAPIADMDVLGTIQAQVVERKVTPKEQIVDAGYVSADHLITSRTEHAIELLGPVADDHSWQARAGAGFAAAQFVLDWDAQHATCPQGQRSVVWMERTDRHQHASVQIRFSKPVCAACVCRAQCTQSATAPRSLLVRERDHYLALQAARERQQSELFKSAYARRAGIEGTIAQGTRTGDLRRSRYIGLVKTRLMHLLLGAALKFMRVAAWLAEIPRSRTRRSAFAALARAPG
jgi:transposase